MFYRKSPKDQQDELDRTPSDFEVQYSSSPTCFEIHERWKLGCDQTRCRNWMNYEEESNMYEHEPSLCRLFVLEISMIFFMINFDERENEQLEIPCLMHEHVKNVVVFWDDDHLD